MANSGGSMPKTIWFVWFQGLRNAPYVVRKCHESWVVRNPDWRVVALDEATLPSVASVNYSAGNIAGLSRQHQADLLRLDLLGHHGGAWADATCFCVQPLGQRIALIAISEPRLARPIGEQRHNDRDEERSKIFPEERPSRPGLIRSRGWRASRPIAG